ncbi:Hypothetical protein EPM1_3426 [Stenotrophomonas maltophilia EPM1]|nr:Hypothetical protein EPM1_3426 [Stenotrophomonas maltophilia EPM1]
MEAAGTRRQAGRPPSMGRRAHGSGRRSWVGLGRTEDGDLPG